MRISILTIPIELRFQIYSYLYEPALELNLCNQLTETRLSNCAAKNRQSPLLTYMHKRRAVSQWARRYGIHLLATDVILAQEYIELINRSTILTFHCPKCLTRLLLHLRNDLGLKQSIFKKIRTRVDVHSGRYSRMQRHRRTFNGGAMLEDTFAAFQLIIIRMYGACSLVYDELDQSALSDPERKWLVEKIRIIGFLPERLRISDGDAMDNDSRDYDSELTGKLNDRDIELLHPTNEEDMNRPRFQERLWGNYETMEGVTELDRWKLQWPLGEHGDESMRRIKRRMRMSCISSFDDEWRMLSQHLTDNLSDKRKSFLVNRDELWLGVTLP